MVQLSPCDHLVYVAYKGYYHCEGSQAVSNALYWRKTGSLVLFLPEQLDRTPNDTTDMLGSGQKQISGEVKKDVAHCGARNLTGKKMLLTEKNTTCPAQREKNEHGVEYYWPEINLGGYGRTQTYSFFGLFCSMVLTAMGDFMLLPWCK